MKLYVVRHGQAYTEEANPERPLSPDGQCQARRMAEFLRPLRVRVGEIRHSTKLRAKQTAEILATAVATERGLREVNGIAPNDPILPLVDELAALGEALMIVGHLPFVADLSAVLLGLPESAEPILFPELGTVCFESTAPGLWSVLWAVQPEILPTARV